MKILWLSWKDYQHPLAGGAELFLREISRRLVRDGHDVTVLTAGYDGAEKFGQFDDGVKVIRVGRNRYVHSFRALSYYLRRLRNQFDAVIEVVNTAPYFSPLFGGATPVYLFYHQLAREIWFYETKPPLSHFGFHVLEPLATRLMGRSNTARVMTESESSKNDLLRYGFDPKNTDIISLGIEIEPAKNPETFTKFDQPTVISLGAMRAMKRTLDQVKAFEIAKQDRPDLQLLLAGDSSGAYGKEVARYCQNSPYAADIQLLGRVSKEKKIELMQRAHAITVTSVKEGWGLIVTEAASQGTPAVVYDVDGLRDSVRHGETGFVTEPKPTALAHGINKLLDDTPTYERFREAAWQWSKTITFDRSYQDFKGALGIA